ncbi:DUF4301 family protein [Flavobacterium aurantiibacter]|uniref:ATPase n=1 Tax=Flavobacterium aurantiibacter TaxID=2023067 RepID=A0A255ZIH8_9FLAO|nr:DUF4301 family protein [Flavobacterium aurantiibacter]OYQ40685.1 hypothetical protein CHX27_13485 [Flavobacterium aurantiibacter]
METKTNTNNRFSGLKIVVFGPESSGKTTLAKQLAAKYNAAYVPEFARKYIADKVESTQQNCTFDDILPIAKGQLQSEQEAEQTPANIIFYDTNPLLTAAYSECHYNKIPEELENEIPTLSYDLYLLTEPDIPWEADSIRQHQNQRQDEFRAFKKFLKKRNLPYARIKGTQTERIATASAHIDNLLQLLQNQFKAADYLWVLKHQLSIPNLLQHINIVNNGIAPLQLAAPATPANGILVLEQEQHDELVRIFDEEKANYTLAKFVPASGAASRMFKFLLDFLENYAPDQDTINAYINKHNAKDLAVFLVGIEKFPFYDEVIAELKRNYSNFDRWNKDLKDYYFIKFLLSSRHFNFASKPKAVLPFHKTVARVKTPIDAHLEEALAYIQTKHNAHVHFTISPEFQADFQSIVEAFPNTSSSKIDVSYSVQESATDTIAVANTGLPYYDKKNHLVCRPAGHGALLGNLNRIKADIVFIKNIDNVSDKTLPAISFYKKMLAGKLIQIQKRVFEILQQLEAGVDLQLSNWIEFAQSDLNISASATILSADANFKKAWLFEKLNRPIRVCGMVKNEGEPGGGPFWVLDKHQQKSLQIVESAQINLNDPQQKAIFDGSTHFNPVDLVCAVKDFKGNAFDLHKFVDPDSGFIVEKSKDGQSFKAYELPGLWNGSMADWITIFVEVPLQTFNPVKTVNDLLKPAHQP